MLIHKRFQKDYKKGSIEVQVNFSVENNSIEISTIHIHSNFDSGLPTNPTIESIGDKKIFIAHYKDVNGKSMKERIIGNEYSDDIINSILEIQSAISTQTK
jgi:hypothetical protein